MKDVMGQSLVKNTLHIIFSTRDRMPLILPEIEEDLYNYLGGLCNKLDSQTIKVGGNLDHVHLLCALSKKIPLMKLIEEVKSHSSKWMKTRGSTYKGFYWQKGYGAISVSPKDISVNAQYICDQRQHHARRTFQDEYRSLLSHFSIQFDERYVWE